MNTLSDKERNVLRQLITDSSRSRKLMAGNVGLSEPEFSKTTKKLVDSGIIKKFTVALDYKKLGFPDRGIFIFSLKDKKFMKTVVAQLLKYKEIIEIQEVFGEDHDLIVSIMAEDNERIRIISDEISTLDEVKSDAHTFTLIFALNYKREDGVEI